jgi:hypothetical protein
MSRIRNTVWSSQIFSEESKLSQFWQGDRHCGALGIYIYFVGSYNDTKQSVPQQDSNDKCFYLFSEVKMTYLASFLELVE